MPPLVHVIYIPSVLMLGFVLGYIYGGRAARDAEAARKHADEAKAARKAERERKAAGPQS